MSHRNQGSKWISRRTRARIHARDGGACVYCQLVAEAPRPAGFYRLTLDHLHPRKRGGSNEPTNLVTVCHVHNSQRRALPLLTFVRRIANHCDPGCRVCAALTKQIRRRALRPLPEEIPTP